MFFILPSKRTVLDNLINSFCLALLHPPNKKPGYKFAGDTLRNLSTFNSVITKGTRFTVKSVYIRICLARVTI